jgi:hypothetical protein
MVTELMKIIKGGNNMSKTITTNERERLFTDDLTVEEEVIKPIPFNRNTTDLLNACLEDVIVELTNRMIAINGSTVVDSDGMPSIKHVEYIRFLNDVIMDTLAKIADIKIKIGGKE